MDMIKKNKEEILENLSEKKIRSRKDLSGVDPSRQASLSISNISAKSGTLDDSGLVIKSTKKMVMIEEENYVAATDPRKRKQDNFDI